MEWTFTVPGQPVPQPRPKFSTRGGFGRAYTPTKHPINAFRQAVSALAAAVPRRAELTGPVQVVIEAVFARPRSHLRKNGLAKDAPAFPPKCDWDNLGKGVCDAITGCLWVDDDQVVDGRVTKRYAVDGEEAHTRVTVRGL
jgi:Holliday junction resolvase RusA-like endonuclease